MIKDTQGKLLKQVDELKCQTWKIICPCITHFQLESLYVLIVNSLAKRRPDYRHMNADVRKRRK